MVALNIIRNGYLLFYTTKVGTIFSYAFKITKSLKFPLFVYLQDYSKGGILPFSKKLFLSLADTQCYLSFRCTA